MPILNRHKVAVPGPNGVDQQEYLQLIKIDKDTALFSLTVPEHLLSVAAIVAKKQTFRRVKWPDEEWRALPYQEAGHFQGEVTGTTRAQAGDDWGALMYRCGEFLASQAKVKVLLVQTEMNLRLYDEGGKLAFKRVDLSSATTMPLVGVSYQVCFQVGSHLVDGDNRRIYPGREEAMRTAVIPYTEEREAFLCQIVTSLERAAVQLHGFMQAVQSDPLHIEAVMKQGFLLDSRPKENGGSNAL